MILLIGCLLVGLSHDAGNMLGLSCDMLGLSRDRPNMSRDMLGLSRDMLGLSRDMLGLSHDMLGACLACHMMRLAVGWMDIYRFGV